MELTSHDRATIRSVLGALTIRPDTPSALLHHRLARTGCAEAKVVDPFKMGHTSGGQVLPFNLAMSLPF